MYIGSLPVASNRATYSQEFQLYDDEDGEGVSLADATITVELREPGTETALLTGTTTVTDESAGAFTLSFTTTQMRTLCAMQYEIGITIEQNDETIQYLIGTLPVLDGIVS